MSALNSEIKDKILLTAMEEAAFDGWVWDSVQEAAENAGYERHMAAAVFPSKLKDVLAHLSDWADREMLARLTEIDPMSMRVRDRIRLAVQTRLAVLKEHKEAVKHSTGFWLRPFRKYEAARMVWRTADRIWDWAGDPSSPAASTRQVRDYNFYTKRGLLSGVLTSTTLYWMNDDSTDQSKTLAFLDNRIENVMQLGKTISTVKDRFSRSQNKGHA